MDSPNQYPFLQKPLGLEMDSPNQYSILQESLELEMDSPNQYPFLQKPLGLEMDSPNQYSILQESLELEMDSPNQYPFLQNSLEKRGMNENFIINSNTIIQNPLEEGKNHLTDNLDKIIQNNPNEEGMNNFIDNSTPFTQNSLEEQINNFIDKPNNVQNSLPTGYNIVENMPNPQHIGLTNNEGISNKSIKNIVQITKNNNRNIALLHQNLNNFENETTIEKTKNKQTKKNLGRRTKGSNLKGGHTGNYPGNILRKNGTGFMDSLYNALNYRCEINNVRRLKRINFNKQFGYNKDNKKFINTKIYKILRYGNNNNKKVIKKMTEEKRDFVFTYMINCTFKHLYAKYIRGKNKLGILYSGKVAVKIKIKCFETLIEIANKKEFSKQFKEECTKEKFIESSKQFINEVNGKGKLKFREIRNKNKVPCQYKKVEKIENSLKNNKFIFIK